MEKQSYAGLRYAGTTHDKKNVKPAKQEEIYTNLNSIILNASGI